MGTGSTSFLSLRDNVLFCILCYTPFPIMSDRAKLSKYVHNDIGYPRSEQCHFGPVAQHSLGRGSKIEERIYIGQCYTISKKKLRWENIWKVYKQSNRNSKWSFIPMPVVYHIQSIIDDFSPSLFPDCVSPLPYFEGFTSSSLLLFGRFSFSFNIRFKVKPSGFKLNKYYNYNKTDSSIMFKLLLYSFG